MKILFDASIHFGQFSHASEETRIACKNSQASISTKPKAEVIGVLTFNENSWADHVIWDLERNTQDTFYKFMDVFHSVKNIQRIPLSAVDTKLATELAEKRGMDIANTLTLAAAISHDAKEIHTLYQPLLADKEFFKENYGIEILRPTAGAEIGYPEENLEEYYQAALQAFKQGNTDLLSRLHTA